MRVRLVTYLVSAIAVGLCVVRCTNAGSLQSLAKDELAPPPQTINVELRGYTPSAGREFHNLFVSNFSVVVDRGALHYSAARDGLWDDLKQSLAATYGFGIALPDTLGNGYGDILKYQAGVTYYNQAGLFCGTNQRVNSANDGFSYRDTRMSGNPTVFLGLRDCEKSFLQLNTAQFDFDGDGIPDYLEVRSHLNPKNTADANLDVTDDNVINLAKVQQNIPIDEDARTQPNRLFAYNYKTRFDTSGVRTFEVTNIPVLNGGVENFLAFYLTETDQSTHKDVLYTAFMILHRGAAGITIPIPFWGADPAASHTNQELVQP